MLPYNRYRHVIKQSLTKARKQAVSLIALTTVLKRTHPKYDVLVLMRCLTILVYAYMPASPIVEILCMRLIWFC